MKKAPFKIIRLPHHDYTGAGAYFVTLCAHGRKSIFGKISRGEVVLNDIGQIVEHEWLHSAEIRKEILFDAYVIMPNHLHGIVIFIEGREEKRADCRPLEEEADCHPALRRTSRQHKARSLSTFIAQFKAVATTSIRRLVQQPNLQVWQTRFFDRVIRSEAELNQTREYIFNNPVQWEFNKENPSATPDDLNTS